MRTRNELLGFAPVWQIEVIIEGGWVAQRTIALSRQAGPEDYDCLTEATLDATTVTLPSAKYL